MPQLIYIYILHNLPLWMPKQWFQKIEVIFRELICKRKQARIGLRVLQQPKDEGELAVPHHWSYFLTSQMQHLRGCNIPEEGRHK